MPPRAILSSIKSLSIFFYEFYFPCASVVRLFRFRNTGSLLLLISKQCPAESPTSFQMHTLLKNTVIPPLPLSFPPPLHPLSLRLSLCLSLFH